MCKERFKQMTIYLLMHISNNPCKWRNYSEWLGISQLEIQSLVKVKHKRGAAQGDINNTEIIEGKFITGYTLTVL